MCPSGDSHHKPELSGFGVEREMVQGSGAGSLLQEAPS